MIQPAKGHDTEIVDKNVTGKRQYAQKRHPFFVKFVHTYLKSDDIITIVKPPNTLYSFCYTPFERYLLRKKQPRGCFFLLREAWIISYNMTCEVRGACGGELRKSTTGFCAAGSWSMTCYY
ncbi:MAG: hypothetical protein LUI39_10805 [Lachnospiraceae bacterium]|nr:hypothetical protein [Lachnospiraceae bacterium]